MRIATLVAVMTLGLSAAARADVVSVGATLGTFDNYYGNLIQDVTGFNTSLGVLTSVTVNTRAFLSEAVQVQPAFGSTIPFIGLFNVQFDAQVGGSPRTDRDTLVQSVPTRLDAIGNGVVAANVNSSFTIPAADWPGSTNPFGDTPLTIFYDFLTTPQGGLSFPFDGAHTVVAGGSVSVDYTYTAAANVPEPASLALLGAGLLGVVRQRRASPTRQAPAARRA